MFKNALLLSLVAAGIVLASPSHASDPDTRELTREIMKLHGDIRMSAAQLLQLAQNTQLTRSLTNSDNATILAALESIKARGFSADAPAVVISEEDISSARHKIEIYKMLCYSAKEHAQIYTKYCAEPPYENLYSSYISFTGNASMK